jgi:hypothetical protein
MAFESYLGDARTRPFGLRLFGYVASLTIHVPPLTLFVFAWLTRELVLDHAFDLPSSRSKLVYYEVPVQIVDGIPGGLFGDHGATRGVTHARTVGGRTGNIGSGKRRIRRPLTYAHAHKRVMGPVPLPTVTGHDDHGSHDGNGHGHKGTAFGDHGTGPGERGAKEGEGGGLGTVAGLGASARDANARHPESVSLEAKLASWIPPELEKRETGRGKGGTGSADAEGAGQDQAVKDEQIAGPPQPGRPQRIPMNFAAYLRTYEAFPTLPESCWPPGRLTNSMLLEICVSDRGSVDEVMVRQSAGDEVDGYLTTAVRNWRYRPRVVQGVARPFCHLIRIVYSRSPRIGW